MAPSRTLRHAIERYRRQTGKTQAELAQEAGVQQSAISRICSSDRNRTSRPYHRLCDFMQQRGLLSGPVAAYDALDEAWDGTEEHEAALVGLIVASKGLRPGVGKASDGDG